MEQYASVYEPPTMDTKDHSFVLQGLPQELLSDKPSRGLQSQTLQGGIQGLASFFTQVTQQTGQTTETTYGGAPNRGATAGVAAAGAL